MLLTLTVCNSLKFAVQPCLNDQQWIIDSMHVELSNVAISGKAVLVNQLHWSVFGEFENSRCADSTDRLLRPTIFLATSASSGGR